MITTLVPLIVVIPSVVFLGERIAPQRWLGVITGLVGVVVIALARGIIDVSYPMIVALATLAPISWSVYTLVSKRTFDGQQDDQQVVVSPLPWTYTGIVMGVALMIPFLPHVTEEIFALDRAGWMAVGYLAIPCTVLGFTLWVWLLQHLPASTLGLTVFMNPPLTLISKAILTWVLPQVFVFTIVGQELVGGLIVLAGLAVALLAGGKYQQEIYPPLEGLPGGVNMA